ERVGRAQSWSAAQIVVGQRHGAGDRAREEARAIRGRAGRAEHVVDAQEIGAIEEIERLDGEFQVTPVIGEQAPPDAQVEAVERLALTGVTPGLTGTVALRTSVGVGGNAGQKVERTTALLYEDRREAPVF